MGMKVFEANLKDIKPYEHNPRVIPQDAVDRVAESIKQFGMQQPIVVDKDMVVIVGHTRLRACEQLRMGKVPCVIADNLTEAQVRAYRLADNKTNEFTSWDYVLLDFELGEIPEIDMSQFGFDLEEGDFEGFPEVNDSSVKDSMTEREMTFVFTLEEYAKVEAFTKANGKGAVVSIIMGGIDA